MGLSRAAVEQTLTDLPGYVRGRTDLWYTVLNERDLTRSWVNQALADLTFV